MSFLAVIHRTLKLQGCFPEFVYFYVNILSTVILITTASHPFEVVFQISWQKYPSKCNKEQH